MNNYQIRVHIATLHVLYEVCTYKFCNRTLQCLKFERSVQFWLKIISILVFWQLVILLSDLLILLIFHLFLSTLFLFSDFLTPAVSDLVSFLVIHFHYQYLL